ncbi:MAG: YceI family protein, partial [Desulfococcus multivorans]|nr:YceI family protein [Desulfococcus multivorans]
RKGAPEAVAITPLIVYQNFRGRSVYQGRYTTLDRIRNFIRTSRYVPQEPGGLVLRDIPVRQTGRATIWAPVKIARVTGSPPPAYDHDAFVREARTAMDEGFTRFKTVQEVRLSRADRGFYMDLYPWLANDGTLFLSLAVYSQFHCKAPVFERKKDPLTGPWSERRRLFREAARILEKAVDDQIADTRSGDGFDPVETSVRLATWDEIGLPLPEPPTRSTAVQPTAAGIPRSWRLSRPGPEDPPLIQFHFQTPLDHYRGEVMRCDGRIDLVENRLLEGATGWVTADPGSVTMGDGGLDDVLGGRAFLDVQRYPESAFTINTIRSHGNPLAYGRMSPASVEGIFTLKGRKTPLSVTMEMEPVFGPDNRPLLLARGVFDIDLDMFGIEGADGPSPANRTLVFDLFLQFRPEAE